MADTRLLLDGLVEYRSRLEKHLQQLNADFQHLENEWRAFSVVYEGDAANQFRSYWQRTVDNFKEYIERTQRIARLLEERIQHLEKVNRTEENLN